MSDRFERAFAILKGHEGGYSSDPTDWGNWTGGRPGVGVLKGSKFGISAKSYPKLDIANLTIDDARAIYRRDFWAKLRCDDLPPALALLVFDSAVNNGVRAAAKWMQQAAGVARDGVVGPLTVNAAQAPGMAARFHATRAEATTRMRTWPDHGRGWAVRLAALPFQALDFT